MKTFWRFILLAIGFLPYCKSFIFKHLEYGGIWPPKGGEFRFAETPPPRDGRVEHNPANNFHEAPFDPFGTCDTCQHWQALPGGECHCHTPVADADGRAVWPKTRATDVCGDFKRSVWLDDSAGEGAQI